MYISYHLVIKIKKSLPLTASDAPKKKTEKIKEQSPAISNKKSIVKELKKEILSKKVNTAKLSEVAASQEVEKKINSPKEKKIKTKKQDNKETESLSEVPSKKAKKYEGATEEESKWLELRDKHKNIKPQLYKLSEEFVEKTPLEHKVLGWGFILSVVNDRLEVLFSSGIKHLISNYKKNN